MDNVPIIIRIPEKQLHILDSYANEKGVSRADIFRNLIIDAANIIEEKKTQRKIICCI